MYRLMRDRERLPDCHRKLYDAAVERVTVREGLLLEREGALRAEAMRDKLEAEARRKEALDEMSTQRATLECDIREER